MKMNVAPRLLEKKLFPNLKEITESMGALSALQMHLLDTHISYADDPDILVIGDGHRPRTAALILANTPWEVISIDPCMRQIQWGYKGLHIYQDRIEALSFNGQEKTAIMVCVHSHALLSSCIHALHNYQHIHIINIPCCIKSDILVAPDISYRDNGIHSEKNRVDIYFNIKSYD